MILFNSNGDMYEPVHSALSLNIVTAIVLLTIVCSTMGALIEQKKSFAGQERGNIKIVGIAGKCGSRIYHMFTQRLRRNLQSTPARCNTQ